MSWVSKDSIADFPEQEKLTFLLHAWGWGVEMVATEESESDFQLKNVALTYSKSRLSVGAGQGRWGAEIGGC